MLLCTCEGRLVAVAQVSCSFDYLTRSASNLAYNYCLMFFEFVLPVTLIVLCYVGIVLSVRRQAGELRDIHYHYHYHYHHYYYYYYYY